MEKCKGNNDYYHLQTKESRDDQHRHLRLYQCAHERQALLSHKQEEDWAICRLFC